jgi:DNA-directed RNA polymerase omega subunit
MLIIEQCLEKIPNPFLLIAVASQRVRELSLDANFSPIDKKKSLIALDDVAQGDIDVQKSYEKIVNGFRKIQFFEERRPPQE